MTFAVPFPQDALHVAVHLLWHGNGIVAGEIGLVFFHGIRRQSCRDTLILCLFFISPAPLL